MDIPVMYTFGGKLPLAALQTAVDISRRGALASQAFQHERAALVYYI